MNLYPKYRKSHNKTYLFLYSFLLLVLEASAGTPKEFMNADRALGARLIKENNCVACHQQKVGGDGSSIYRPQGRINNPSALITQVEVCNTELNLSLFPEEVVAIAAALNTGHYLFK